LAKSKAATCEDDKGWGSEDPQRDNRTVDHRTPPSQVAGCQLISQERNEIVAVTGF